MKFVIVAVFIVLETSCFVVPEQEQTAVATGSSHNLGRVKRSCACGPYGCTCTLREPEALQRNKRNTNEEDWSNNDETVELKRTKRSCSCGPYGCACDLEDTDDSFLKIFGADTPPSDIKRSKRSCSCGPYGCSCTLREPEENEQIQRNKRNADEEILAYSDESAELNRMKRSCSCGPYGCACDLEDTDGSFLKIFGADVQLSELKRSKRNVNEEMLTNNDEAAEITRTKRSCSCGPYGCSCTFRDPEESEHQRNKRNANEDILSSNDEPSEQQRMKRSCFCGPYGCPQKCP